MRLCTSLPVPPRFWTPPPPTARGIFLPSCTLHSHAGAASLTALTFFSLLFREAVQVHGVRLHSSPEATAAAAHGATRLLQGKGLGAGADIQVGSAPLFKIKTEGASIRCSGASPSLPGLLSQCTWGLGHGSADCTPSPSANVALLWTLGTKSRNRV